MTDQPLMPPWLAGAISEAQAEALQAQADRIAAWMAAERDRQRREIRRFDAVICDCGKRAAKAARRGRSWSTEPSQLGCMIHGAFVLTEDGSVI